MRATGGGLPFPGHATNGSYASRSCSKRTQSARQPIGWRVQDRTKPSVQKLHWEFVTNPNARCARSLAIPRKLTNRARLVHGASSICASQFALLGQSEIGTRRARHGARSLRQELVQGLMPYEEERITSSSELHEEKLSGLGQRRQLRRRSAPTHDGA